MIQLFLLSRAIWLLHVYSQWNALFCFGCMEVFLSKSRGDCIHRVNPWGAPGPVSSSTVPHSFQRRSQNSINLHFTNVTHRYVTDGRWHHVKARIKDGQKIVNVTNNCARNDMRADSKSYFEGKGCEMYGDDSKARTVVMGRPAYRLEIWRFKHRDEDGINCH